MPADIPPALNIEKPPAHIRFVASKTHLAKPHLKQRSKKMEVIIGPTGAIGIGSVHKPVKYRTISQDNFSDLPITSMQLPATGWWYTGGLCTTGYDVNFQPNINSKATLSISSPGVHGYYSLSELLALPPHTLSKEEIRKYDPNLLSDTKVYTGLLQGKKALFREYRYEGNLVYRIE